MRFRSIRQLQPKTLEKIERLCKGFQELLPFTVYRFLWGGSYARDCAGLHSDVDINLDIGTIDENKSIRESLKNDPEKKARFIEANKWLSEQTRNELGVHFSMTYEFPCIADDPEKRCYSILEKKWYHEDDPSTLLDARKKGFGYVDEDGVEHPGVDPFEDDAKKLKNKPGFIDVHTDIETAHYRK